MFAQSQLLVSQGHIVGWIVDRARFSTKQDQSSRNLKDHPQTNLKDDAGRRWSRAAVVGHEEVLADAELGAGLGRLLCVGQQHLTSVGCHPIPRKQDISVTTRHLDKN